MAGLIRKNRRMISLVGDMLFSILTIQLSFNCLNKWVGDTESQSVAVAICAMYAAMGAARLFRALQLRDQSRSAYIAHLIYGAVFWAAPRWWSSPARRWMRRP